MVHSSNYKPGKSGNPNGRPPGSRNKRTRDIINQIVATGHKDPLLTLSELQATAKDEFIRAMAANMLAPFMHGKVARPQPKFIETEAPLDLPPLNSLNNAVDSIARIETALIAGSISTDDAQQLIAVIEAYIRGKNIMEVAELTERLYVLEQAIAAQPQSAQLVHLEPGTGLPSLPGTNIKFPRQLNGQEPRALPPSAALGEPAQEPQEPET